MQKRAVIGVVVSLCLGAGAWRPAAAAEVLGHQFGQWPTVSAVIHDENQKELNLDERDFLIEIWFRPLALLRYKDDTSNVLVAKKCADLLPGYTLSYHGSKVALSLCGRKTELERDQECTAEAGLTTNTWVYLAAGYAHRTQTLTLFKDGSTLKEFRGVDVGSLSNRATFNIAYYDLHGNTPAHCRIREVRIWKLRGRLPDDLAALIAAHHRDPAQVSAALTADAACSRWVFGPGNDDVKDRGNNGNALCYVPWGYKEPVRIKPFPAKPSGATRYVDNRHAQAADDGPGTRERPFRTLRAGLKATYPGDMLHVCAGVYREALHPRAGENGKPVTIEAEDGAVVLGSDPLPGWQPHPGGLWTVTNWTGEYEPPMDAKEADARSDPGNVLFVDDEPMDSVKTRVELVPGTWTVEPIPGHGPKTLILYPLPGIDPARATVEITARNGLTANMFTHVRGLRFRRAAVSLRGRGNLLEQCTVEWAPFCCLSISGQDHVVRKNRLLWGGNSGVGGSSARLLFEDNLLSYNGWREFSGGWHGGAIKFIPANTDHIMRRNELCYNDLAAIWYDCWNQGNLIEDNVSHDNSGHGGIFEEISFGNRLRNNLCYNNEGSGIVVAETSEDELFRNILFNNSCGITFRSGAGSQEQPADVRAALKDEFWEKLDVRRYQGLVSHAREKTLRDFVEAYWCRYEVRSAGKRNVVRENIIFENGGWNGPELSQVGKYGRGAADTNIFNRYDGNFYWNRTNAPALSGAAPDAQGPDVAAREQQAAGIGNSRFVNPWDNRDQMPAWFRQCFTFRKDEFRPIAEVNDGALANVRKSTARTVLVSRLLRSKTLERLAFADPQLFGVCFEAEGKRCAALWSKGVATRDFLVAGARRVVYESKYLKRTTLEAPDGRVGILVGEDPVTLLGIGETVKEDRSVVLTVPLWTEPGKPVAARLLLENADSSGRNYDLALRVGDGWMISNRTIRRTLDGGQKAELEVALTPPAAVRSGMFRASVAGTVNGKPTAFSRSFGIGSLHVLKHAVTGLTMDGDLADWGPGIPNGIAEARDQVVRGAEQWKGPEDLSARAWLRWTGSRELFLAVEVTDDCLVTTRRGDRPAESDSVQLMVDVRAPWRHFMKDCTPGTFNLTLVPGDGPSPAAFTYGRLKFADVREVASRKTPKGYVIELDVHFHTGEVEDPGWVANRPIRLGVLVNDADDPAAGRKATIGAWRTAADAAEDCSSLTTFVTEK
jgi:parallel beta-helix repeat protein